MTTLRAAVTQVIEEIYDRDGCVTAEGLVAAAADPASPIRDAFTWDDGVAAHRYRLVEARTWIRSVRIVHEGREERLVHVRVRTDAGRMDVTTPGHYRTATDLQSDPQELEAALGELRARLSAAREALGEVLRIAGLVDRGDIAAIVAEMARATEVWRDAVSRLH